MSNLPILSDEVKEVLRELIDEDQGYALNVFDEDLQKAFLNINPKTFFIQTKDEKESAVSSIMYGLWKNTVTAGTYFADQELMEDIQSSDDELLVDSYNKIMDKIFISNVTEWITKEMIEYYMEESDIVPQDFIDQLIQYKANDIEVSLVDETYQYYNSYDL